jgi:hypothetical protein
MDACSEHRFMVETLQVDGSWAVLALVAIFSTVYLPVSKEA